MKKKVLLLVLVSFLAVSVVSAASLWGSYKGNDVIRLTVDGDPIKVSDVPAISYNSRTMIPIYLLQQAGVQYTWDQKNKTVDIKPINRAGTQEIDDLAIWAGVADYFFELVSISSDFYNAKSHLDIIAASLMAGASVQSVEKGLKDVTERLRRLKTDYDDIKQRHSNQVHADMASMKYSSTKLANIELAYTNSLNTMLESALDLVEWNRTDNSQLKDAYLQKSISANTNISDAKFEAENEFKIFQNGIIIAQ